MAPVTVLSNLFLLPLICFSSRIGLWQFRATSKQEFVNNTVFNIFVYLRIKPIFESFCYNDFNVWAEIILMYGHVIGFGLEISKYFDYLCYLESWGPEATGYIDFQFQFCSENWLAID